MMPDHRLSLRSVTVATVCLAGLTVSTFAFPFLIPSASAWVSAAVGLLAQEAKPERSATISSSVAPAAVLLSWNTFGNAGTEVSEPSVVNDPNIAPANLTHGSGVTPAANANRFGGNNWFDTGDTSPTTLTESVAGNDYIQFEVTPNSGMAFTPTSLVFTWDRSSSGASSVALRSSADGFTSDLGTVSGLGVGTFLSNTITISGLTNLSSPTTFRIYGYGATATGGTGGFDSSNGLAPNVVLNGSVSPLPVPGISVNPNVLNFPNQVISTTSSWLSITVLNTGSADLVLGTPTFTTGSQFTFATDPNGTVIPPGETGTISFTFTPTSIGVKTDTVPINSNAPGTAPTVALSGTGVEPQAPPQVATDLASQVTGISATLNGSANPAGAASTGYFYYGTTDTGNCLTLGTRAPVSGGADLGSGMSGVAFAQAITGLTPATTYYFCAAAENVGGVSVGSIFSFATSAPPTEVSTDNASGVTAVTSTLNGLANPNGASTVGYFRYSSSDPGACDDSFGTRAPGSGGADLGSGTTQLSFSQPISGLSPATTYWYCAIAESSGGRSFGSVFMFTTAGIPDAATEDATAVTATTATLNGFGTPNGAATTGYFRYGTTNPSVCDDSYGSRAPGSGGTDLGSGTTQVPFSQGVTGLSSNTTYYFCAAVANDGGANFGSTFSFTTPARVLVVDNTSDLNTMDECTANPNDCSLRGAVAAAQDGDTITFDTAGMGIEAVSAVTITLGGSVIAIDRDITISGPGADKLTISGNNASGVFAVFSSTVEISGLTVTGGTDSGIAITAGAVTLSRLNVTANSATDGGGLRYSVGGTHAIYDSTFSANQATGAGGGIFVDGGSLGLTIVNSTVSGNSANNGGGIYLETVTRDITITSSTITGNTGAFVSGLVNSNVGSVIVANSLIAGNTNAATVPDVDGDFTSLGYNLIGNPGFATGFGSTGDQLGSPGTPIDPKLGLLENNGGTTPTHALLVDSPAIDKGSSSIGTDADQADQRGVPRPVDLGNVANAPGGDGSDIGAYELLAPSAAEASISGRVTNVYGVGIRGAAITVTAMDGTSKIAYTNSFGHYSVDGLSIGGSFVVSISARRYAFEAPVRLVNLSNDIDGLDFTASP